MKTSFAKRLKGLLALTLCTNLFIVTGMTAMADEPVADYILNAKPGRLQPRRNKSFFIF